MPTPREKFQILLKKLFQFDCAELDFGIYRIMNHKRAVIEQFIEKDLFAGVTKELTSGALIQESSLAAQLVEVAEQIKENLGEEALDAEGELDEQFSNTKLGKRYLVLKSKAGKAKSRPELEALIFNHLYSFFSRYYDEGDFMALRRYSKRDKYAIPYNGEEVYLHWANSDQYYIKTAENFTDYSYKHGGWTVRFALRNAEVEQNNKKGAKRFFIPRLKDVVLDASGQSLTVPFEYRPLTEQEEIIYKSKPQETILSEAATKLMELAKAETGALSALTTEKRKNADGNTVSLIDHHLRSYTRKNTSDFFIHKDLKGFLERELDFYLKNEVLNLDELEAGGEFRADGWFQIVSTMKAVGRKIIAFVSQIENFQKRIFEKKKFVTEVNYCITLDRVPEEFYPEIIRNKEQIEEWKRLFDVANISGDLATPGFSEPLSLDFLIANRGLIIDTAFFGGDFKSKLIAAYENLDDITDGLLIHGENFQALSLLRNRYRDQITCNYIDPPYNATASEIIYKNDYLHSSWLALMKDRLQAAIPLMSAKGNFCITIDDYEAHRLRLLLEKIMHEESYIGTVLIRNNPSGRSTVKGFAVNHEYALFFARPDGQASIGRLPHTAEQKARYSFTDSNGQSYEWENFKKNSTASDRSDRPKQYYPIYFNPKQRELRIPKMTWQETSKSWIVIEKPHKDEDVIFPIDDSRRERVWRFGVDRASKEISDLMVKERGDKYEVYKKKYLHGEGSLPRTWWDNPAYSARDNGTRVLVELFGNEKGFDFPKAVEAVKDCIKIGSANGEGFILDYFGGSGTTAHAVIELNREDDVGRQYILIEIGDYFDTVLKPRIQKAVYSKDWKAGKPKDRHSGTSHCFKYLSLESYEDALDNITFKEIEPLLQFDDYVLSYMLDFETKESDTLLNVAKLDSPFDYKLRLQGKDEPLPVDLPETFNYLIGLHVDTRKVYDNNGMRYLVYRGKAEGRETVIIWRTIRGWGEKELKADKDFILAKKLTEGAEDIFVNGDSFVPGARSLDPLFKQRMFDGE